VLRRNPYHRCATAIAVEAKAKNATKLRRLSMEHRPKFRRVTVSSDGTWMSRVRAKITKVAAIVIAFVLSLVAIQMIAHSL
jgi:hypothetical protein